MSECRKCGRTIHRGPLTGFAEGRCTLPGGPICDAIADGRRRGMREGVELARELVKISVDVSAQSGEEEGFSIDLSDVDAELARRLGDA